MIHPQIFENFEIKKPLRRPCGEDGTHTPHKKPIQKTKCSRGTHTQRMAMGKGRGFNQHSNTLILHIQAAWRGLIVSLDLLPCKMCFLSATSGPMWGKVWLVGISYLVSSWTTLRRWPWCFKVFLLLSAITSGHLRSVGWGGVGWG